jgi:hypothetical protein
LETRISHCISSKMSCIWFEVRPGNLCDTRRRSKNQPWQLVTYAFSLSNFCFVGFLSNPIVNEFFDALPESFSRFLSL